MKKKKRTIKSPPSNLQTAVSREEIGRAIAKAPPKRMKKKAKKVSFWTKVKNFFFPKNFKQEMQKGMEMSSPYGLGAGLYKLGKFVRKKIDPEHKMKIGK